MNATEMKPAIPASKYPDGYLDALSKEFHESTQTLKKLASAPPAPTQAQSDRLDEIEYSMLKRQDQILELCSKVKATSLIDVMQILTLWHAAAIQDVAPEDVRQTDHLILALSQYFVKNSARKTPSS